MFRTSTSKSYRTCSCWGREHVGPEYMLMVMNIVLKMMLKMMLVMRMKKNATADNAHRVETTVNDDADKTQDGH